MYESSPIRANNKRSTDTVWAHGVIVKSGFCIITLWLNDSWSSLRAFVLKSSLRIGFSWARLSGISLETIVCFLMNIFWVD